MQFRWNHTQGAPDYDRETGFGFVTGAVYTADAALHIPETNSGFLPLWWYAGTPIFDIRQSEYGRQATAAEALRTEDAAGRRLPVWLRIQVPGEGVYRAEITVTGTDGGEVLVFTARCFARGGAADCDCLLRCLPHRAARAGRRCGQ